MCACVYDITQDNNNNNNNDNENNNNNNNNNNSNNENNDNNNNNDNIPAYICPPGTANYVTLMFVLSAISPNKFNLVIKRCYSLLKEGGMLFIRDYGRHDMCQLKQAKAKRISKLGDNYYVRGDGTKSYFFTTDEIADLSCVCGFDILENTYHSRVFTNRSTHTDMHRIWIQAKLVKPYTHTHTHTYTYRHT
eukprot:GHVR01128833.1.p1 GENE.GHVR01128833.1~~GHVR01128833.1.p1  ORF type:complete len:192 (-),score=95.25 GHVR01128833.1:128-703(-)